jgi:hypothetical protein
MLTESLLPAFAAAADFHLRLAGAPLPVAMALSMARQNFSNYWRVHWPASLSPICQANDVLPTGNIDTRIMGRCLNFAQCVQNKA